MELKISNPVNLITVSDRPNGYSGRARNHSLEEFIPALNVGIKQLEIIRLHQCFDKKDGI